MPHKLKRRNEERDSQWGSRHDTLYLFVPCAFVTTSLGVEPSRSEGEGGLPAHIGWRRQRKSGFLPVVRDGLRMIRWAPPAKLRDINCDPSSWVWGQTGCSPSEHSGAGDRDASEVPSHGLSTEEIQHSLCFITRWLDRFGASELGALEEHEKESGSANWWTKPGSLVLALALWQPVGQDIREPAPGRVSSIFLSPFPPGLNTNSPPTTKPSSLLVLRARGTVMIHGKCATHPAEQFATRVIVLSALHGLILLGQRSSPSLWNQLNRVNSADFNHHHAASCPNPSAEILHRFITPPDTSFERPTFLESSGATYTQVDRAKSNNPRIRYLRLISSQGMSAGNLQNPWRFSRISDHTNISARSSAADNLIHIGLREENFHISTPSIKQTPTMSPPRSTLDSLCSQQPGCPKASLNASYRGLFSLVSSNIALQSREMIPYKDGTPHSLIVDELAKGLTGLYVSNYAKRKRVHR
ncbi:hypothetical protein BGZ60DRAFT_437375 [Tricladium varicosporioides]|nr:hypothetical protein BGZ60DRAFT_437375 [Hymenoscyphus varicosporioides]